MGNTDEGRRAYQLGRGVKVYQLGGWVGGVKAGLH